MQCSKVQCAPDRQHSAIGLNSYRRAEPSYLFGITSCPRAEALIVRKGFSCRLGITNSKAVMLLRGHRISHQVGQWSVAAGDRIHMHSLYVMQKRLHASYDR